MDSDTKTGPAAADCGPNNLVVLRGIVSSDPIERQLSGGEAVVQFDVTTVDDVGDRSVRQSVPAVWHDPSSTALIVKGAEVLVVGAVRRRFFRVGGATQSRTEVVVERVVPSRRRKQVVAVLSSLAARLG